tara:strand:+ start:2303 stop:2557 length:255 start_codon:yes stop_codon:yes gene_type:complete
MKIEISELELNELKEMRRYFGENDKTIYEQHAFYILNELINKLTIARDVKSFYCWNEDCGLDRCKKICGSCETYKGNNIEQTKL